MTRNSNSNMRLALSYTDYPLRVACMTETWRSLPATACDDLANARGGRGHSTRTLNEPSWCWARPSTTSISASLPAPAARRWPGSRHREARCFRRPFRGLLVEVVEASSAGEWEEHVHHVPDRRIIARRSGGARWPVGRRHRRMCLLLQPRRARPSWWKGSRPC